MRLVAIVLVLAALSCESVTEVNYVTCETMEVFPNDSIATLADSVRFDECSVTAWNGNVIRRKP